MKLFITTVLFSLSIVLIASFRSTYNPAWESKLVTLNKDGSLSYHPDEKGNTIPDFSRVGYYNGDKEIPDVGVKKTLSPSADAEKQIQSAIDELAKASLVAVEPGECGLGNFRSGAPDHGVEDLGD